MSEPPGGKPPEKSLPSRPCPKCHHELSGIQGPCQGLGKDALNYGRFYEHVRLFPHLFHGGYSSLVSVLKRIARTGSGWATEWHASRTSLKKLKSRSPSAILCRTRKHLRRQLPPRLKQLHASKVVAKHARTEHVSTVPNCVQSTADFVKFRVRPTSMLPAVYVFCFAQADLRLPLPPPNIILLRSTTSQLCRTQ